MSLASQWTGVKTFPRGIHPPEFKEMTEDKPIRRLAFPPELIIPLSQHTGAPAKPIVREGQEVVRGEPIAEPSGFVSVPMHAPATGVIEKIGLARDARGTMSPAIFLKAYPGATQEVLYGKDVNVDALSREELIKAVQSTGVVGLGGAAFPTHVKLAVPEGKSVDTVIANGCECEPYLTTDYRVMLEYPADIIKGLQIIMKAMGVQRGIIGVEDNKLKAVEALTPHLPADGSISVQVCKTKYPQGAEKMLVKALLGREVPSGGLPIDCGAAVFNVATLAQIGELLPRGQGLIERVITITGPGVTRPGNFMTALGTPLRYVLDFCGYKGDDLAEVILGGPMMGVSIGTVDIPITKGITGVLVMTRDALPSALADLATDETRALPCIRCASCVKACPMGLNPSALGALGRKGEYEDMAKHYHLFDCFECGSCSYVCPSSIPLVQYFRIAKAVVRQKQAAAKS
ncbi:MAG TPA: electron transport complex subunit RsxC [Candidatus Hydrogenedentes bacterium]|nr:electron transport complex subunit RsxC [Candidatus Hydrogenedentota bacterium]HOL76912.1 electron transport complex subunit RsxC [Candidatus Hydrogenedentota bacterium]HPO85564.1 electron transport complex subunit RsxC [Candidatus Hydrogenedentota bacterium]